MIGSQEDRLGNIVKAATPSRHARKRFFPTTELSRLLNAQVDAILASYGPEIYPSIVSGHNEFSKAFRYQGQDVLEWLLSKREAEESESDELPPPLWDIETPLLIQDDVERYLSISSSTLYRYLGGIPYYRISANMKRFSPFEVEAWLEMKRVLTDGNSRVYGVEYHNPLFSDSLVGTKEISHFLQKHVETVRRWRKEHGLPYFEYGKWHKFRVSEVELWNERRQRGLI